MCIKGVVFDLDGTLVDSRLDFDAMRKEMGIIERTPILEALDGMTDEEHRKQCWQILLKHEQVAAVVATPMPGVEEFLQRLSQNHIPLGVLTRNSQKSAEKMLELFEVTFSIVVTRNNAPHKPAPDGLRLICKKWQLLPSEVLFIGDFWIDMKTGENAGTRTAMYGEGLSRALVEKVDFEFRAFSQAFSLIEPFLMPEHKMDI